MTVTQALHYCAKLRLPAGTPPLEIDKLVTQTISRLALDGEGDPDRDRTNTPIHRLSGGQRKRVSVGVELLGRPSVIYLDEPTSGLDPATEFKLMELLRHLADGGCTVICTTHVMENVFLTDKVYIINGRLAGVQRRGAGGARPLRRPQADHAFRPPAGAQGRRMAPTLGPGGARLARDVLPTAVPAQEAPSTFRAAQLKPARPSAALPILLARQWAILCADWKNFLILFGQPLIIAALVGWVTADSALSLFFAYLATLWFGCSNAAQEIVKELPIYRRERMVGLGSHSYLISKFSLMGTLTAVQGVFLYVCLCAATWLMHPLAADADPAVLRGVVGSAPWQLGAIVLTAYAAAGIGFAISAIARSTMQAVMIVPLVLIPQILFSGLVVETKDMSRAVYALTNLLPSYSAQTMMDLSQYWKRPYTQDFYVDHPKAADHLKDITRRDLLAHPSHPGMTEQEAKQEARSTLNADVPYSRSDFGTYAAIKLFVWAVLGYVVAWFVLRKKERG